MTHADHRALHRPIRWLAAWLLVLGALGGCSSSGGPSASPATEDHGPNRVTLPTLPGGVELDEADPASVLVGEGLSYGAPLPSEQAAGDVFAGDPEVTSVVVRRVLSLATGRLVATARVLQLDGAELFDEGVLDAFVQGTVGALVDGDVEEVEVAGRTTYRASAEEQSAAGYLVGDLLVAVTSPAEADADLVVERQLAAMAAGEVGSLDPVTPLIPLPIDAAFVAVSTVTFEPIPPPEDEVPPEPPSFPGATGVQGRYGVVAGERRTTVWAFTIDPVAYPSAEALAPALAALVTARAGGAAAAELEVVDRVVVGADGAGGAPSARAFRHQGLVLLVEGLDPAQLDATVADWITALG